MLLVAGAYDQSSRQAVPPYKAIADSFGSDAQFAQTIQRIMSPGASILQVPYVPFPENPTVNCKFEVALDRMRANSARSGFRR